MVVEGKVEKYMEGNKFVSVSTGLKGSTQFIADELQIPGKPLKVGSSRRFIVQRMEDPLGDLELNMSKLLDDQRATNIWAEIKAANERQQPVMVGECPIHLTVIQGVCDSAYVVGSPIYATCRHPNATSCGFYNLCSDQSAWERILVF
jgi:hypothetical protein